MCKNSLGESPAAWSKSIGIKQSKWVIEEKSLDGTFSSEKTSERKKNDAGTILRKKQGS